MNWFRLDPLFTFRMIFHGWHPNSPLSHPILTRRTFFSDKLPDAYIETFQDRLSPYESFLWIMGMSKLFVDPQRVLKQISGWGVGQRLLVLRGEEDKLMNKLEMDKLASFYRRAFMDLVSQKKVEAENANVQTLLGEGDEDNTGHGVRVSMVPGAGHHLQNDVTWEVGARKLLDFYQQL